MYKFRLILADPPWSYKDKGTRLCPTYSGRQRSGPPVYPVMPLDDICALGEHVREIAHKDSVLLLWSTHPLKETHPWPVIKAWGFRYSTAIPWVKARWDPVKGGPVYRIGGGHTVRSCSEELLVCIRGAGAGLVTDRGIIGSLFAEEPIVCTPQRSMHSSKPDEQYILAERMDPGGPYLEMFARSRRAGWHAWGDQVKFDI